MGMRSGRLRFFERGAKAFLVAALICIADDAHAVPIVSASAGPGKGQGDTCNGGGTLTSSGSAATWGCTNSEGNNFSQASASPGALKALAFAFSKVGVNKGSVSVEQSVAQAASRTFGKFRASGGLVGGVTSIQTTLSIVFTVTTIAGDAADSLANAAAYVNGQLADVCTASAGLNLTGCDPSHLVTVPINVAVPIDLSLDVFATANASGQITDEQAIADASHTFSFPVGGTVFNLPTGFTFDDPDAFIFNNIYTPPGAPAPAAVPEPPTLALFGFGLLSFWGCGLMRKITPGPKHRQQPRTSTFWRFGCTP